MRSGQKAVKKATLAALDQKKPPAGPGDWISGMVMGAAGARRYYLYRPPGVLHTERLPLLVMLHGCGQNAKTFADSTRMNRVAARERFLVLYPEQDFVAHPQGCWHWYDIRNGKAYAEDATLLAAIDQVGLLYPADLSRVAIAGMSAGAGMAALMALRHPDRFKAVAMHSGVRPGVAQSAASALRAMRADGAVATQLPLPAAANLGVTGIALPPLLVLHGSADTVVNHRNARLAAQQWADATGAEANAARLQRRGNRYPMRLTDFKRAGRTLVTLCEVDALGHAWSGGTRAASFSDARGPDASRMVWAFVVRQLDL